jgi:aspartyl-tRNA(Asn)/glutamyl-tRNA(Gln) amidotransferase subunit C
MATPEEVTQLAALARLSLEGEALTSMTRELDAILSYVGQLESLDLSAAEAEPLGAVHNVLRADDAPHEPGAYTEALAPQFPEREGSALSVKQIISHD